MKIINKDVYFKMHLPLILALVTLKGKIKDLWKNLQKFLIIFSILHRSAHQNASS